MSWLATGQGSNSANLRQYNERVILTALRRLGQASKADLARHARLTDNTAGVIVRELRGTAADPRRGPRTGARGQPATLLCLEAEGAYAHRRQARAALARTAAGRFRGRVLEHRRHRAPLPAAAGGAAADAPTSWPSSGAPSRRAGPTAWPGSGSRCPTIWAPGGASSTSRTRPIRLERVRLAGRLGPRPASRVLTENDGTAAAVAELFHGHGRDLDSFLYIFVGTAIGGGVVLGGDYYRGRQRQRRRHRADAGRALAARDRTAARARARHAADPRLDQLADPPPARHGVPVGSRAELDQAIGSEPGLVEEWLEDCADALVGAAAGGRRLLDVDMVVIDGDLPGRWSTA